MHSTTTIDPILNERLAAARNGDGHEFSQLTEPYRRELLAHCYRILGSLHDAEDAVQETMLRAWRRLSTFEGRASLRAWLYRIATNACFDALDKRPRRTLPALTYPAGDPHQPLAAPIVEPIWLEPYPDDLLPDTDVDPEARYAVRESVTLAFLAALQGLPPRQRAVLILCDVLDWRAGEVAELLETTVSAVNSALHRARTTMAQRNTAQALAATRLTPVDEATQSVLAQYVTAWEAADVVGLTTLLREDAVFSMPPIPSWYRGRAAIEAVAMAMAFSGDARDRWRLTPIRANAQPAFGVYQRDEPGGAYRAFGIQVLTIDGGQITDITTFVDPTLFARFTLPDTLPAG